MTALVALGATMAVAALTSAPSFATKKLPAWVTFNQYESFAGHFTGSPSFELSNRDIWSYSNGTISGEIDTVTNKFGEASNLEDKMVRNVTLKFSEGSTGACYTSPFTTKELVWTKLYGVLGYISSTKEVGLMLFSQEPFLVGNPLGSCFSTVLGSNEFNGRIIMKIGSPGYNSPTHELLFRQSEGLEEPGYFDFGYGVQQGQIFRPKIRFGSTESYSNAGINGTMTFETPHSMYIEG